NLLEQARVRHSLPTPEVGAEEIRFERDEQNQDESEDGNDLCNRHDGIDEGGLLNPTKDHEMEDPDTDRGDDDCRNRISIPEDREESPERGFDQHPVRDV